MCGRVAEGSYIKAIDKEVSADVSYIEEIDTKPVADSAYIESYAPKLSRKLLTSLGTMLLLVRKHVTLNHLTRNCRGGCLHQSN